MGEKYSVLLVEGMLQRVRNLQRAIAMKEDTEGDFVTLYRTDAFQEE